MPSVTPIGLRIEDLGDVPEWGRLLVERLNAFSSEVSSAVAAVPESAQLKDKTFTSESGGSAYVDMKNPLDRSPTSVAIDKFGAFNGDAIASAYSHTWAVASDRIRILFVGLSASTKYRFSVTIK